MTAAAEPVGLGREINLNVPRYDQSTFSGRAKHFCIVTNPLNVFATGSDLDWAKDTLKRYRDPADYLDLSEDQLWRAKNLYDSAFHPDTGEKMFLLGRMSAQVPTNMAITGSMMTFYKTVPAVVFWQWFNQSFNAVVNYTNRSGDSPISPARLGLSYVVATTAATGTALTLNKVVTRFPPLIGRFVPFAAVAAANCLNIPCMRSREVTHGIPVFTSDGQKVGESQKAAKKAITQVIISRIVMASPGMLSVPIIMNKLDKGTLLKRMPALNAPIQVGLVGLFLVFATPLCCAIFPQTSSMAVSHLESELQEAIKTMDVKEDRVYFNKGL